LRTIRLLIPAALLAAGLVSAVPAQAQRDQRATDVKVMTRNIFLGGDILKPVGAQNQQEFEQKATELWQEVQGTNFPRRAPLLAKEIDQHSPDLIGLQEVALWRRSPNGVKDGQATPSTQVVYDFLKLLQRQLRRRGQIYRVVESQREADIEASTSLGYDVRLTMRDVILAKKGVRTSRPRSGNFNARLTVPTVGGTYNVLRGWTSTEVNVDGNRFKFVNTHLEAFGHPIRTAQAQELIASRGPARSKRPVILVGDLNSDDAYTDDQRDAYVALTGFGFKDRGTTRNSCCYNDLFKGLPKFDHKIDHILTKPGLRRVDQDVTGNDPRNRAANGLYPSDHGGAVSVLRFPRRR
jgi:endonuclease/exonuclease/phosphatase family metal-dependent hydrolase